jgi:hypothetical protein
VFFVIISISVIIGTVPPFNQCGAVVSIHPRRIPVSDVPANPIPAAPPLRRDEEIALEMMKFVATTTGFGRTGTPGAGFQGGTVSRAEDYAKHLLDLYGQCLEAVRSKR